MVDDETYFWHLNHNSIDTAVPSHITIQKSTGKGQILFLDPYPWSFEIRPKTIENGILWSLKNGWNPESTGPPFYVGYRKDRFILLPPGAKFTWDVFDDIAN